MRITATPSFRRDVKRLDAGAKKVLDQHVRRIAESPAAGDPKKGDLAGVYSIGFKLHGGQFRIAYRFSENEVQLIAMGARENFYQKRKRKG